MEKESTNKVKVFFFLRLLHAKQNQKLFQPNLRNDLCMHHTNTHTKIEFMCSAIHLPTCNRSYRCRQLQISNYFTKLSHNQTKTQIFSSLIFSLLSFGHRCHKFSSSQTWETSNKSFHVECLSALFVMRNWFRFEKFSHSKAKNSINYFSWTKVKMQKIKIVFVFERRLATNVIYMWTERSSDGIFSMKLVIWELFQRVKKYATKRFHHHSWMTLLVFSIFPFFPLSLSRSLLLCFMILILKYFHASNFTIRHRLFLFLTSNISHNKILDHSRTNHQRCHCLPSQQCKHEKEKHRTKFRSWHSTSSDRKFQKCMFFA